MRHKLGKEKEAYTEENMHGLVLDLDCTVFESVLSATPHPPP